MLTLNDGRSELWQFDTGRTLDVDADCSQVHFSNKVFGRSIDVDAVDGVAIIPDVLLQTDKDLNVWAFVGTAENGYTKISKTFRVNRRNKPADYVFTPVEQTTIAEIAAIAQSVRDDADAGLFDGRDGVDGYTPIKGVDYFDGAPGSDGKTPEYGVDYGTPEQIAGISQQAAEILEPEVNQIKSDLINVNNTKVDKSELAKTNLYLDALHKLNVGQTYDVLEQESEAFSVDVPSGAKYVGIDKVGGYSEVIDGEIVSSQTDRVDVVGKNLFNADAQIEDFTYVASNRVQTRKGIKITNENGTYTAFANNPKGIVLYYYLGIRHSDGTLTDPSESLRYFITANTVNSKGTFTISDNDELWLYDALEYGSMRHIKDVVVQIEKGSTATAYSAYSLQQITTNFPALNSTGSVYDYIDLNEGKLYTWTYTEGNEVKALAEPVVTEIEIPTELSDWLTVETGGSITFHNADDGKRLLIPNKLSFVRKLDEVSV